ncbi:SusD/RagB family nutrient-binding outer membrane lipoprotein, partial [Rufibacter quisquiliarum]
MKKVIYSVFTLLVLSAAGCSDDFFDINKNPNSPTTESVSPQLILPRVQHAVGARMAVSYDFAAHWMGYWARSGTYG